MRIARNGGPDLPAQCGNTSISEEAINLFQVALAWDRGSKEPTFRDSLKQA